MKPDMTAPASVHEVYERLAVEAAMCAVDNADESNTIEDLCAIAARVAAQTVLQQARVPDRWPDFVSAMTRDPEAMIRAEVVALVFDHVRPPEVLDRDHARAIEAVRSCCRKRDRERLADAVLELEISSWYITNDAAERAFALGYQIARDPAPFIFLESDHE